VGPEIGYLRGAGGGVTTRRTKVALWGAGVASISLTWALSSNILTRLDLSALFPIASPEFDIDGHGLIHRPAAVLGRAAVGAGWRF
jgi:hypothetical protein